MKKKFHALSFALAGMLMITGCSSVTSKKDPRFEVKYTIGISQFGEHPSLDEATKGFIKALKDNGLKDGMNIKIDIQNAQFDMNNTKTIADNFVGDKVDLIFANATPSAVSALNATKDIPIVFTSVTDPVGAGLVKSFEEPGANITGTTDNHPDATKTTIDFITQKIGAKKIGIVYNSGEQNSVFQVKAVEELAAANGASVVTATVSTSAEVKQATESLIGRVDAIYVPTDNTVVSALESVISVANDKKIPLFAGELDSLKKGAVAASGFDYFDLGYQTGQMATEILNGRKKPSEIPVELPERLKLVINKKAAANQGVEIDPEWENEAEVIDGE